tara:strand:+ start:178 stop:1200 length:1023 start_codon:yes stop_codon:yes gene_type:complete
MVKSKTRTTYVNEKKISQYLEKDPLSKDEIIKRLGITEKTLQRASSLNSKKRHRINKKTVSDLAKHFGCNYSDLVDIKADYLPPDLNRTTLHKITNIDNLARVLSGVYKNNLEIRYDSTVLESTAEYYKNILQSLEIIKSKNDRSEFDYIDALAKGNDGLRSLNSYYNYTYVYAGTWNINYLKLEEVELINNNESFDNKTLIIPNSTRKGMILFSDSYTDKSVDTKIIYPSLGLSFEKRLEIFKKILKIENKQNAEYTINHYFGYELGISYGDWYENYSQTVNVHNLPSYSDKTDEKTKDKYLSLLNQYNDQDQTKYEKYMGLIVDYDSPENKNNDEDIN